MMDELNIRIKGTDITAVPDADRLQQIFFIQEKLQRRLNPEMFEVSLRPINSLDGIQEWNSWESERFFKWLARHAHALAHEAMELEDWTPWKWWSERAGNKDEAAIPLGNANHIHEMKMEVVDALHFLVNCAMMLGMDADELYTMYLAKNNINHERQDTGNY